MIYIISDGHRVKLGKSKDPTRRVKQLQTGSGVRLRLLACYHLPDVYERRLHGILRDCKTKGEWFDLGTEGTTWLVSYVRDLEAQHNKK